MSAPTAKPPLVLTIAGFDPTAGAGIAADLKTFAANHSYGLACITCLTVQNTQATRSYRPVDAGLLEEQLDWLLSDVQPRAVKIGMLGSAPVVEVVARQLERHPIDWVVLDPIADASQGVALSDNAAWEMMQQRLFPLTGVLTPNLAEAERLTGLKITRPEAMEQAAEQLHARGPRYVVVTGGHLDRPLDVLYDGGRAVALHADRVRTSNTHGTGCTFSAALAANLAHGTRVADAVVQAKAYVTAALKQSYAIGTGPGPLNHLFRLQEPPASRNVDPAPGVHDTVAAER